jgi:AbrB family looped-hinge helix DNA binding protein
MKEKKEFETTLTSKGQVVIGSKIREELGLKPRQKLVERIEGKKIVLEPMEPPEELKGSLKKLAGGRKTDEIMREVKEGWV